MPELGASQWLVSLCWFCGCLGIATVQLALLGQVWQITHRALLIAIVSGFWLLGAKMGGAGKLTPRFPACLLIGSILASMLLPFLSLRPPLSLPPYAYAVGSRSATALLLGWSSTAWQGLRRGFPAIGERWVILNSLVASMVGLTIAWACVQVAPGLPLAPAIGLALLLPLVILDRGAARSSPLPAGIEAQRVARLIGRSPGGPSAPVLLDRAALPRGWWLSYLSARSRLPWALQNSAIAVVLGGVWGVLPTPFAAQLTTAARLPTLLSLLAGQAVACALVFAVLCGPWRGVVGLPARQLPAQWQRRASPLMAALVFSLGAGLLSLGLLQSPWQLGVALGGYSLAGLLYFFLMPRAAPSITTETMADLSLLRLSQAYPPMRLLALRQAEENLAFGALRKWESALTIGLLPVVGALIDHFSVDGVLFFSGSMLTLVAVGVEALLQDRPLQLERWFGGSEGVAVKAGSVSGPHRQQRSMRAAREAHGDSLHTDVPAPSSAPIEASI